MEINKYIKKNRAHKTFICPFSWAATRIFWFAVTDKTEVAVPGKSFPNTVKGL
jgi:hypothetical protein